MEGADFEETRKKIFEDKVNFHKEQTHFSFEEKIKILVKLQEIASRIRGRGRSQKGHP